MGSNAIIFIMECQVEFVYLNKKDKHVNSVKKVCLNVTTFNYMANVKNNNANIIIMVSQVLNVHI